MIAHKKKKANIAAGVYLVRLFVLVAYMVSGQVEGNIWETGNALAITIFSINGLSLAAALWLFAEAKGYWGILGLVLIFLNIFGLLILLALPDRRKEIVKGDGGIKN